MPVSTRARERKAAEVSANVHFLRSSVVGQSNVVHNIALEQSAKKRKQQKRRKSTERQRASPAKKAAVQAKDTAQHVVVRDLRDEQAKINVRSKDAEYRRLLYWLLLGGVCRSVTLSRFATRYGRTVAMPSPRFS